MPDEEIKGAIMMRVVLLAYRSVGFSPQVGLRGTKTDIEAPASFFPHCVILMGLGLGYDCMLLLKGCPWVGLLMGSLVTNNLR